MNVVINNKMLLKVLALSASIAVLPGCSLTEFVKGSASDVETNQSAKQAPEPTPSNKSESISLSDNVSSSDRQEQGLASNSKVDTQPSNVEVIEEVICVDLNNRTIDCPSLTSTSPNVDSQPVVQSGTPTHTRSSSTVANQVMTTRQVTKNEPVYHDVVPTHSLSGAEHSVVVEEYIERVATDLINSLGNSNNTHSVIGVTSFVDFNNHLKTVTPFGNRISEIMMNELQQTGFVVADYKVRDTISVEQDGDYVFSRDVQQLNGVETMTHVLTGTIMYQQKGLKINARVVDFDTKWVVASASTFMPYFVLDTIVP